MPWGCTAHWLDGLIAIGSGGIKPCVSANVGDQFGPRNQHLLERVYSWFYFSINFGSIVFDHPDSLTCSSDTGPMWHSPFRES